MRFWWLVLLTVVLAVALGAARNAQTGNLYESSVTVYLGQPLFPNGIKLDTVESSATTALEIAQSNDALRAGAEAAGTRVGKVRSAINVRPVAPPVASKATSTPQLIRITGRSDNRAVAGRAPQAIAEYLVSETNTYATKRVKALRERMAFLTQTSDDLTKRRDQALARLASAGADQAAVWVAIASMLSTDLKTTRVDLSDAEAELELAEQVESSRVITQSRARQLSASSGTGKIAVAALVGLLLGCALALVAGWVASTRANARRSS